MHKIAFQADNRLKIMLVAVVFFPLVARSAGNKESFRSLCCHSFVPGLFRLTESLLTENMEVKGREVEIDCRSKLI